MSKQIWLFLILKLSCLPLKVINNEYVIFLGDTNKEKAQLSMGQASEFSLSVEDYDINELEADITSPSGKAEPCILKKLPNGHLG